MTLRCRKPLSRVFLLAAILVAVSSQAHATVYDLSQLASSHSQILYQWTFDIGAEGDLQDATTGGVNLVNAQKGSPLPAPAAVGAGYDTSGSALRSYQATPGNRDYGAALRTATSLGLPESGTVEYLFNVVTAEANGAAYIVSAELDTVSDQSRRYFGAVDAGGGLLRTGVGATWGDIIPGNGDAGSLSAGEWYYVALTYEPNSGTNRVNAYVANLTGGDTTAAHTLINLNTNATAGAVTAPALGLGCFGSDSGDYRYFFDGFVDQVSIYGARLSHTDINAHVTAIQQQPDLRADLDVYRNYPGADPNWVPDASSWNNDAVLGESVSTTTYNPTRKGYGFDFDSSGDGDMLTLDRNESLRVADIGNNKDMSVEMWLKADALDSGLVDARDTNFDGWLLTMRDDGAAWIKFYRRSGGVNDDWTLQSEPGLFEVDGEYRHFVVSIDANDSEGGTATFYVDGQQWGIDTYTDASDYVDPMSRPIFIGHQALGIATTVTPFDGEIARFALYAKALDQQEVLARFALGVPEPTGAVLALIALVLALAFPRRAA